MSYPDSLLMQVTRPGRYTGNEWGIIRQNWGKADLRLALCYPDLYEIGMSNMAIGILYSLLNGLKGVLAERVFAPWPDMDKALRKAGLPLISLESGRPLAEFDVLGFSLGYELTFTNILSVLDLAGLPLWSRERGEEHPLVIAGGSACLNPEPVADFFDMFVLGEAETLLPGLVELMRQHKHKGRLAKAEFLRGAASIPGIYVPSLYDVSYDEGRFQVLTPKDGAPASIRRQIVDPLPPTPVRPIVPFLEIVHDRAAVEVSRGCARGCRFCNAGTIYRPVRERPLPEVVQAVEELIENTGYDEVSLVSLSSGDYTRIDELVAALTSRFGNDLAISLPSLRLDDHSVNLVDSLPGRRKSGLTFAPEAGSARLQRVINKHIPEEELLATAELAFARGWKGLKLYFMLGLPTETDEDALSIERLVRKVLALGGRAPGRTPQVRLSLSTFVPKPHTPFQWAAQESEANLVRRHEMLRHALGKRVKLSYQDTRTSLLEAVLSRGDRRLAPAILRAWQKGAVFDGWSERFNYQLWQETFDELGIDPDFYAHRTRDLDEPLPWEHIDTGLSPEFLKQEYRRALAAELSPYCRADGCNACGLEGTACP